MKYQGSGNHSILQLEQIISEQQDELHEKQIKIQSLAPFTKREAIAIAAMQGLLAKHTTDTLKDLELLSTLSVNIAEYLLAALEEPQK